MDSSNIVLIGYVALWILTFYYHQKRSKYFGSSSFIILLYLFYAIASLYCYNIYEQYNVLDIKLMPFVYLYICTIIAMMPVLRYNEVSVREIDHPRIGTLDMFIYFYIACSFIQIPAIITHIWDGVYLLLTDFDAGSELYTDAHDINVVGGGFHFFTIIFNIFSDAIVIFFFYYWSFYSRRKLLIWLLGFTIIIQVLLSISQGLRTQTVLKCLSLFVGYISMRAFMRPQQRKTAKMIGSVFGILIVLLVASVSISRFAANDGGVESGTVRYIGQGNLNFNGYALYQEGIRYGDRTANTFKSLIGFDVPNGVMATRLKYSNLTMDDGVFSTFVGDFVLDYGPFMTIVLFVIFSFITCQLTIIRNGKIGMHQLLALYFVMCVVTQGGFYLFSYSFTGNYSILAFVVLYLYFYFEASNRKTRYEFVIKS